MNSPGFIPEILVPGMFPVYSVLVLLVEFSVVQHSDVQGLDIALVIPILLATSYLVGLSMRHLRFANIGVATFVPENRELYHARLIDRWPIFARQLIIEWSEPDDQIDPDLEVQEITVDQVATLVNRLRVYQFCSYEASHSTHLNYQWNLARLAKNSIPALGLVSFSSLVIMSAKIIAGLPGVALAYLAVALLSILLIFGLRKVHIDRIHYLLDTLVRATQTRPR